MTNSPKRNRKRRRVRARHLLLDLSERTRCGTRRQHNRDVDNDGAGGRIEYDVFRRHGIHESKLLARLRRIEC